MNMTHPSFCRPTWLEIDPQRVVDNFNRAKQAVGPGVDVFPVVKADSYGLGAVPISFALAAAGARGLCVGLVEEAEELRRVGITLPLVLFAGLTPGTEQKIVTLNLSPFLYDLEAARLLNACAVANRRTLSCFVKVDTGMGRIGFQEDALSEVFRALLELPALKIAGVVSHLACGDEGASGNVTVGQIVVLQRVVSERGGGRTGIDYHSLANSAGILYHPQSHFGWVRPGIMLYGGSPAFPVRRADEDGLVPVVRWMSRIIQIRTVPPGTPLGYGHTAVTSKTSRIAQIPVGYGDGYSRRLSNRGHVLVEGRKAPIIGRVCMDLTAVDVTDIAEAGCGSLVTLLGEDGEQAITIEELAGWMETIPYEVICLLGKRVPRYHGPFSSRGDVNQT